LVSPIFTHSWDGKSNGTKFTITYAKKIGKILELYIVDLA